MSRTTAHTTGLPNLLFVQPTSAAQTDGVKRGGDAYTAALITALITVLGRIGAAVDIVYVASNADAQAACLRSGDAIVVIDGQTLPFFASAIIGARAHVALLHRMPQSPAPLAACTQCIATSPDIARRAGEITGAPVPFYLAPGFDRVAPAAGSADGVCHLLAMGAITARKQHAALLAALAGLPDLAWHLTIAGDISHDPNTHQHLAGLTQHLALGDRVTISANPDAAALNTIWDTGDILVSCAAWEGAGMALGQALAHGIPAVVGAGEPFPPGTGGIICHGHDRPTLTKILRRLIYDTSMRHRLANAARQTGQVLPDWNHQAQLFLRHVTAAT